MRTILATIGIELKLFLREPLTLAFVLVLPLIVLYVLNGVFGNQADPEVYAGVGPADFYLSAYIALTVVTVGVLALPVHLAGYRERGVLRRFHASGLPRTALVTAHVVVALLLGTVGSILLVVTSRLGYDVHLPASWPLAIAAFVLVTLTFAALGTLLGAVMPTARSAQGLGVILFFVFMMLGGAGPPPEVLPDAMRRLGDVIPMTYAARTLRGPWLDGTWELDASLVMVGVLAASAGLSVRVFRWN